jgi:hypothetical protein
MDKMEFLDIRGNRLINDPIAFCVTRFMCWVNVSLVSRVTPKYLILSDHEHKSRLPGLRLVNSIAWDFVAFSFIFHLLKNFCKDLIPLLSLLRMVSILQEWSFYVNKKSHYNWEYLVWLNRKQNKYKTGYILLD